MCRWMCYTSAITPLHGAIDHAAAKSSSPLEWKVHSRCAERDWTTQWWLSSVTLPAVNRFTGLGSSSVCSVILDAIRTKVSFQNFALSSRNTIVNYARSPFKISLIVDLPPREIIGNEMNISVLCTIIYVILGNNSLDDSRCIKKVSLLHFVILQDIKSTLLYGFVQCDSSVNNLSLTA